MAKHDKKEIKDNRQQLFSYDKINDILIIHKGFSEDERFKGNIEAGDLILDVSSRGRIRGIEINNTAMFLRNFTSAQLESIEKADFNSAINPSGININILFKFENNTEVPAKIAVPLESPILR
jgi:uncharacterized protein YuzE